MYRHPSTSTLLNMRKRQRVHVDELVDGTAPDDEPVIPQSPESGSASDELYLEVEDAVSGGGSGADLSEEDPALAGEA
jgi:hypothetical protein